MGKLGGGTTWPASSFKNAAAASLQRDFRFLAQASSVVVHANHGPNSRTGVRMSLELILAFLLGGKFYQSLGNRPLGIL